MRLKKDIAVSKTGFLFDPNSGDSFNLNKTGQFIVKMLAENKDEKEIMHEMLQIFEVDAQVLQKYMDDFFIMLKQFGIIEKEENQ